MKRIRRSIVGASTLLLLAACGSLDAVNPNAPDTERATATPKDVKKIAISSVNSWYLASTYIEPYMMLGVTADELTANFGNFGMRFNNLEPRISYENNSAGGDAGVAESPWYNNYSTLGAANDALRAFANGVQLETPAETEKYRALAQFVQAATLTNLALLFDQAFIVDETFVAGESQPVPLAPYPEVEAAAMQRWDAVISALAGKDETYDPTTLPVTTLTLNSGTLLQWANTMAAATLAYTPRNAAQAAQVDWAKVLQYAENGIDFDIFVQGDLNNWYSYINYYGNEPSWVRTDMKLIHMMDPSEPAKYTGPSDIKAPATTGVDARLASDFRFHNGVIGDPGRGVYMQSPFSHKRYYAHARTSATRGQTPAPYMLAAENDLLIAEALVRTGGDLTRAATLVNKTRVTRGQLPAVPADADALMAAINYERDVELLNTDGFEHFRKRHWDDLQPGTVRHLPVPAKELEILQQQIYTFGGVGKPDMYIAAPTGDLLPLHKPSKPPRPDGGLFSYE